VPVDRTTPHVGREQVWAGYEAAAWMPTLQDPAQRATLSLRLLLPAGWKATASGRAVTDNPSAGLRPGGGEPAEGREAYSFALSEPAPPFLFAFAAGRFDEASLVVGGVTLRALGPPGADLQAALAVTAPMLSFLEERLGRAFPGAEYREVFVEGDAAQEAAGFSLLAATALGELRADPTEDWIFSHELAHQWFAWLVPCADFGDFWLNEGFATFLVAAFKEQRWGRPAYDREVGLWRRRSAKVHAEGRDAPLSLSAPGVTPRPVKEADLPARGVTYARGALALHRLRAELGEDLFWRGLRRYVKDRAGQGARSEDLRAAFEAATGRDLGPFFATWVYASAPGI
jgi:aminopeptidase N